jgi:hypothetical protein
MSRRDYTRQNRQSQQNVMIADSRKDDKTAHSIGWPHFAGNGNCICMSACCFGGNGCRCKSGCAGVGHLDSDCQSVRVRRRPRARTA